MKHNLYKPILPKFLSEKASLSTQTILTIYNQPNNKPLPTSNTAVPYGTVRHFWSKNKELLGAGFCTKSQNLAPKKDKLSIARGYFNSPDIKLHCKLSS